jgi:hypothetical protein
MIVPKLIEPFTWNYIVENNLEASELRSMIALPLLNNKLSTPPLAATAATISPNLTVHEKRRSEECTPTKIDLISGAASLLLNLEAARRGRSVLFSDEQKYCSKVVKKGLLRTPNFMRR